MQSKGKEWSLTFVQSRTFHFITVWKTIDCVTFSFIEEFTYDFETRFWLGLQIDWLHLLNVRVPALRDEQNILSVMIEKKTFFFVPDRYRCCRKRRSSSNVCCFVNRTRRLRRLDVSWWLIILFRSCWRYFDVWLSSDVVPLSTRFGFDVCCCSSSSSFDES